MVGCWGELIEVGAEDLESLKGVWEFDGDGVGEGYISRGLCVGREGSKAVNERSDLILAVYGGFVERDLWNGKIGRWLCVCGGGWMRKDERLGAAFKVR